ncbi:conserved Plasmodium protein, unknown function [Plasmodium berghei]|uniref:Uncharacterized protein n=1 Tax=Plasmodium berghei TaxID=5821 RepID=A0A1C6X4K6_PLABE|nr:conserved Plasmodium protein, unknown function [Plasmodium berghei]SCM16679.1 conserved Plasmodium protein, unknown function [Plasmodium berghei]
MSSSLRNISIKSVLNKKKTKIKKESCIENDHINAIDGCDTNSYRNEPNVFSKIEKKTNTENLNNSDYQRNCYNLEPIKNVTEKHELRNKNRNTTKACLINKGDENNIYNVKKSKRKKKMSLPMNSKVASMNKNTKKSVENIALNFIDTNVNDDERASDFITNSINEKVKLQGYDFYKNKKSVIMNKSQNANIFKKTKSIKLLFKGKNIKEILNKKKNKKIAKYDQQKKNKCCNLNIDKTKSNSNHSENLCNEENNSLCIKNFDNIYDEINDNSYYSKNNLDNKENGNTYTNDRCNMDTEKDCIYPMYHKNNIIDNIKYFEEYNKDSLLKNGDIKNSDHAAFLKEKINDDKQNIFEIHSSSEYIQEKKNYDNYLSTNCKSIDANENKIYNKCSEYNDMYTNEQSDEYRDGYITYKTYVLRNELGNTNNILCGNGEYLSVNDYGCNNNEEKEEEDDIVNSDIQDRSYVNEIEYETFQHNEIDEMNMSKNISSVDKNQSLDEDNKNHESSFTSFNDLTDGSISSISDSFSLKRLPKIPKNINLIDSNEDITKLDEEDLCSSSLNINLKGWKKKEKKGKRKREVKKNGVSKVYENDKTCYYSTTVSNNKLNISHEIYEDNNIVSVSEEHSSSYLENDYDMNSNISWEGKIKDEYESIVDKNIIRCKQNADNLKSVNKYLNNDSGFESNFLTKIKKKMNKYDLSKSDNYFIDNINDEKKNVEKFYFANSEHSYSNNSSLNLNIRIEDSNGKKSNICKNGNNNDDTHYSDENNFLTSNSLNMQNYDHSSAINIENIGDLKESQENIEIENEDKKLIYHSNNNGDCISQDNNTMNLSLLEMGEFARRDQEIGPIQCDEASNNESEQEYDNCIRINNYSVDKNEKHENSDAGKNEKHENSDSDKNEYLVTPRFYSSNVFSNADKAFYGDSETVLYRDDIIVHYRNVDNNPSAELFYSSSSLSSHNSLEQSQIKMHENKILKNNNDEEIKIKCFSNEHEDTINEKSDTNFENENNNYKIEDRMKISESVNLGNYVEYAQNDDTEFEKNEIVDKDGNKNNSDQTKYKNYSKKEVKPETGYKINDNYSTMVDSSFLIEDEKDGKLENSSLNDDRKKKKKTIFKGNILQSIKKFMGKRGAPSPKKITQREEAENEEKINVEAEPEKEEEINVETEPEHEEEINVEAEPEHEEEIDAEAEPEHEEEIDAEAEPEHEEEINVEAEPEKNEKEYDNNNDKTDSNRYEQTEQDISLDTGKLEYKQFSVSNKNTEMLNINKNVFGQNIKYCKRIKSMEYNSSLYINKDCEKKHAYSDDENIKINNKLRRQKTEQHNKNFIKIDETYDKGCDLKYGDKETKNKNENDHNKELKYNSNDDSSVCSEFNNKKYISKIKSLLHGLMEKKTISKNTNISVEEEIIDVVPSAKIIEPKIVEEDSIGINIIEAEENAFTSIPICTNTKIDEENERIKDSKLFQDDKEEGGGNIPSNIIDEINLIKINNDQLTKENDSLKTNYYNLTNLIDAIKKEKSKCEFENDSLKEQNTELRSDNDSLRSDNETLRSGNDSLRSDNEMLKSDNDSLRNDNETLRSDNDSLRSDNDSLRNDNDSLRNDNEMLKNDNDSLRSDNDSLRNDNDSLRNDNEMLKNDNDSLRNDNEMLKNDNDSLRNDNEMLKNDNDSLRSDNDSLRNDNDSLRNDNEMLKNDNDSLRNDNEMLKNDNDSLRSDNDSLRNDNDSLRNDNEMLKSDNDSLRNDNEMLKSDNDSLRNDNEMLKSDNDSLRNGNETLRSDNDSLRSDNEMLKSDNDSLRNGNETLRSDNDSLRNGNETLRSDNDSLRNDNEMLKSGNDSLRNGNEILKIENKTIKEQNEELTQKVEELCKQNEEWENKISKLIEENEQIKKDMEKSKTKKEYEILLEETNSLKTENINNILKIKLLKDEIIKFNNSRTELEIELENNKTNIMQKNEDINNKNILIDELVSEKKLLEEKILIYNAKIKEIESKNIENNNLKIEISEIKTNENKLREEIKKYINMAEVDKQRINNLMKEVGIYRTDLESRSLEVKKYQDEEKVHEEESDKIKKELDAYRHEIEKIRVEYNKIDEENNKYKNEINLLRKDNDELKNKVAYFDVKEDEFCTKEKINKECELTKFDNVKKENELIHSKYERNVFDKDNNSEDTDASIINNKESKKNKLYDFFKSIAINKSSPREHLVNLFGKKKIEILNDKEVEIQEKLDYTNYGKICEEIDELDLEKLQIAHKQLIKEYIFLEYFFKEYKNDKEKWDIKNKSNENEEITKVYNIINKLNSEKKREVFQYLEQLCRSLSSSETCKDDDKKNKVNNFENKFEEIEWLNMIKKLFVKLDTNENDTILDKIFKKTNEIIKNVKIIRNDLSNINSSNDNNDNYMNTQIDCFKIIAHLNTIFGDILFINSNITLIQQTIKEKNKFMDDSKLDVFKNIDADNDKEKDTAFNQMENETNKKSEEINFVKGIHTSILNDLLNEECNKNNTENIKDDEENYFEWEKNLITFFELCFCSDLFIILCHLCKGINEINSYVKKNEDDKLERSIFYFMKSLDDINNFYKSDNVNTYFLESYVDLFQLIKHYIIKVEHIIKSEKKNKTFEIVYEIYNIKKIIRFILLSFFKFHNINTLFEIQPPLSHSSITTVSEINQENHKTVNDTKKKIDLINSSYIDENENDTLEKSSKEENILNEKFYKDEDSIEKNYWESLLHSQSYTTHMKNNIFNTCQNNSKNIDISNIEVRKYESSQNKNEDNYYWNEYCPTFRKEKNYMNKIARKNTENVLTQLNKITNQIIHYNYNSHIIPALIANYIDESIILEKKEYEKEFSYRRKNLYEENNTSFHILIKKKILENIKLNTIIINSTDFIECIKEDIIKEKLNKNIFFKKNFYINIDIIHKHLCIMFRLNIGIDYDYFYDKFISFLNKIISKNISTIDNDTPQISITNLPKELNYDDSYFSQNNLNPQNDNISPQKNDETTIMSYPLLEIDNMFMGILFSMWQKMEINFFEKIYNDHINYSSNKILESEEISKKKNSDTTSTVNNHKEQNKPKCHLDIGTQNDDNKINEENENLIKSNTFLSKYKISNELRKHDYSIEAYIKLMVLDVFKCTDEKKEISIEDFIILFKKLKINIKIDDIQTIWGIIIGCKNMNIAMKEKISIESFIKKAYTTNPSLIFYEYCKTKVKLKEAKKNIKLLQVYNKKMLLLLKK